MQSIKSFFVSIDILTFIFSCKNKGENSNSNRSDQEKQVLIADTEFDLPHQGNLVEVTSENMDFQVPDTVLAGWTTFRYFNKSPLTHFFTISKLPVVNGEQKTAQDEVDEAGDIYDEALRAINNNDSERAGVILSDLPAWSSEKISFGGVGMLSPGEVGQTDVYLEPGTYIMECYIKTGGRFHATMGMYANIEVVEKVSKASPPEPSLKMKLSTQKGIQIKGEIKPGLHVLEVYFEDQKGENGSGHDVHLVRLSEESEMDKLENWMTWTTPGGMETPAPVGTFLGGVQNLRPGETGYMTVDIGPGDYAWISEGTKLKSRNLVKLFTVNK